MSGDPHPEGNPALAAAAEAIISRRLAAMHWADADTEAHRAVLANGAILDADAALAAAAPFIRAAEVSARVAEQDAVHEDLAALLRALGLGDHARPQSPHEVMLQCIAEVRRIRAALGEETGAAR